MLKTILMAMTLSMVSAGVGKSPDTWVGRISDSVCGARHMSSEDGKPLTARDCTLACVRKGAQYVLIAEGRVYTLVPGGVDLSRYAGRGVRLTGVLAGETITISTVRTATAKPSPSH